MKIEITDSGYSLIPETNDELDALRDIAIRRINWIQVVADGNPEAKLNIHLGPER